MKPFKFEPYLKETIWGGKQIAEYKGIKACSENIGESWEITGVKGHESIVAEGGTSCEDKGLTISELIQKYREKLLGEKVYERYGTDFPLLIKFIDSKQDLSVQVHPDDKLAKDAIDYNVYTDCRSTYDKDAQIAELVNCKYFDVRKLTIDKKAIIDFKIQSFVIAICLKGTAEINGTCIREGETILVPADNNILNITGTAELLTAFVP
ncbi:MAG: type I phosphomannose isomerase catalytic subunit [Prevotella sp.]|nr:type I phosphomannose isomerase catalytic subunit [Prevotella sp.]